jgi:hypothetical protein
MAISPASLKVTLLIPLKDNDGEPFDLATWSWWNDELTELVSGFTDLGVVTGWWRGYSDQNRIVVVIVKTMREVDALRELLREARVRFRQEAMYLEYHEVIFEEVQ